MLPVDYSEMSKDELIQHLKYQIVVYEKIFVQYYTVMKNQQFDRASEIRDLFYTYGGVISTPSPSGYAIEKDLLIMEVFDMMRDFV